MKRIFTIIITLGLVICASASCKSRNSQEVDVGELKQLVHEFGKRSDFHSISLDGLIPALVNGSMNLATKFVDDDEEAKAILGSFDNLKSISVLEYEDATASDKAEFHSRLDNVLNEDNLIMEVKDDEDIVRIYSMRPMEDSNYLEGIIVNVVSDCVLVSLDGKVDVSKLAMSISSAKND